MFRCKFKGSYIQAVTGAGTGAPHLTIPGVFPELWQYMVEPGCLAELPLPGLGAGAAAGEWLCWKVGREQGPPGQAGRLPHWVLPDLLVPEMREFQAMVWEGSRWSSVPVPAGLRISHW